MKKTLTVIEPTATVHELEARHQHIETLKRGIEEAAVPLIQEVVALGNLLEAKHKEIGWGSWKTWVAGNLSYSYYTVRRYIQIAKVARVQLLPADTSVRGALALWETEEEAKEKVVSGEPSLSWVAKKMSPILNSFRQKPADKLTDADRGDLAFYIKALIELANKLGVTPHTAPKSQPVTLEAEIIK